MKTLDITIEDDILDELYADSERFGVNLNTYCAEIIIREIERVRERELGLKKGQEAVLKEINRNRPNYW